jgi:probable addiction module antidote protein
MQSELTNYEADLYTDLANPKYAAMYVASALEDDAGEHEFLLALRDVAEARTMSQVAEDANVNRVSLYKMLRNSGNPHLDTLRSVLKALGLRLSVATAQDHTDDDQQRGISRTGLVVDLRHDATNTVQPDNLVSGALVIAMANLVQSTQNGGQASIRRGRRALPARRKVTHTGKRYRQYVKREQSRVAA